MTVPTFSPTAWTTQVTSHSRGERWSRGRAPDCQSPFRNLGNFIHPTWADWGKLPKKQTSNNPRFCLISKDEMHHLYDRIDFPKLCKSTTSGQWISSKTRNLVNHDEYC